MFERDVFTLETVLNVLVLLLRRAGSIIFHIRHELLVKETLVGLILLIAATVSRSVVV